MRSPRRSEGMAALLSDLKYSRPGQAVELMLCFAEVASGLHQIGSLCAGIIEAMSAVVAQDTWANVQRFLRRFRRSGARNDMPIALVASTAKLHLL